MLIYGIVLQWASTTQIDFGPVQALHCCVYVYIYMKKCLKQC